MARGSAVGPSAGDDGNAVDVVPPRPRARISGWLRRYLPAEVAATAGAISAALVVDQFNVMAATAFAGSFGETAAFYTVIVVRDRAKRRGPSLDRVPGTWRTLLIEFGVAELADTFVVRPLAMYLAARLIGDTLVGVFVGKIAADVIFYTLAIVGYEVAQSIMPGRRAAVSPAAAVPPTCASPEI
jgi:hypothetical protein